jgi:hypothetical protein
VYLNGVHLARADYTATNGSDVVLAVGAAADDTVEIVSFATFEVSAQTFTGDVTASGGTFLPTGDTAAGDDAAVGYAAADGLVLTGQGSTSDVTIKNDADATVMSIPTGTTGATFAGDVIIPDGDLILGSTAVTSTAAEINLIDGGTARGTTAIADGDGVLINDAGTMRQTSVETLATYMGTKGLGPSYTRQLAAPSSPNAGDWWFNTNDNNLYIYDGTDGWLTDQERFFGKGFLISANTFSLIVSQTGNMHKVRYEPEDKMLADPNAIRNSHSYTDDVDTVSAVSNASRGVFVQSDSGTSGAYDYVTMATNGAATNFGDSVVVQSSSSGCDHATRGIFAGGSAVINNMEYITIASVGNATDFGNLTVARGSSGCQAIANTTRGVFCGGYASSASDVMDYITIASAGNANDFGNLTAADYNLATANSIVRGLIFSGYVRTQAIDYITIASAGNATDFGDHLSTSYARKGYCVHNKLYAYYQRSDINTQEKHTIATAANATSFVFTDLGDLGNSTSHATIKGWIAASG